MTKAEFFKGLDYCCFYPPSERVKNRPPFQMETKDTCCGGQWSGGQERGVGLLQMQPQRAGFPELLGAFRNIGTPGRRKRPVGPEGLEGPPLPGCVVLLTLLDGKLSSQHLLPEPRYPASLCWGCP